jgi:triacylglycerol esterase/lipase EstA (alpha/beta hydrolase family)
MSARMFGRARLLAAVFGVVLAVGAVSAPGAAADEPPPPPGANPPSCQPTAQHPRPVILVHGTFANRWDNWQQLSPALADSGYCVYALDYGANAFSAGWVYGLAHVDSAASELSTFVQQVLAQTGASQVDIVGHSQGGMLPRYYLGFLGGAPYVHTLVGLAPSNHGTTFDGLATLGQQWGFGQPFSPGSCDSCNDQIAGSPFMTELNSSGDTVAGVDYTVIATKNDEVVTPYTSQFLSGTNVTNITVQDQCPADFSEHIALAGDPIAIHDVRNALDPANATPVSCLG